jgi:hypothetical protein
MASGGMIVLLVVALKKPKMRSSGSVVVTDGATNDRLSGVNAPLCESTGPDTSMRLTSRIAPVAEADEAKVQLKLVGSPEPTTL